MLEFRKVGKSVSGKTEIFYVYSNKTKLGKICFFGRWRKYCFYPDTDTLFDYLCLNEISYFCKAETNKIFKRG